MTTTVSHLSHRPALILLAFRMHEGGHTALPDWPVFLEFAQRYLDRQ